MKAMRLTPLLHSPFSLFPLFPIPILSLLPSPSQTVALTFAVCIVWFQMRTTEETIRDHLGFLFFTVLYWSFDGMARVINVCEYTHQSQLRVIILIVVEPPSAGFCYGGSHANESHPATFEVHCTYLHL